MAKQFSLCHQECEAAVTTFSGRQKAGNVQGAAFSTYAVTFKTQETNLLLISQGGPRGLYNNKS